MRCRSTCGRAYYIYQVRPSSRGGLRGRFFLLGPHLCYGSQARCRRLRFVSPRAIRSLTSAPPPIDSRRPLGPMSCAAEVPSSTPAGGAHPRSRGAATPVAPRARRMAPKGSR
ncbi:hypothetical protein NDU88_007788 [Pleurodeles waltl]|uniref:Uncharacterized protein n=1 Tax=Pleurodeles waltl TaxID=8319 RepID=A0AAV7RR46_PLEWA|nr:hypothetical protein NDU88_007788 [Pleurodeles waltl]